jgi:hypothetical protein
MGLFARFAYDLLKWAVPKVRRWLRQKSKR